MGRIWMVGELTDRKKYNILKETNKNNQGGL